ncbi:hypothetical protein GF361_03745 [Candidatus Woesearchaeota archaeon]|nr:hypothetical protein [Candidatus Woesearchaeota archaeon]
MKTSRRFFEAYAKQVGIPKKLAHKIIDGKYKPYLSRVDDQYYDGSDAYDAKVEALQQAIKKYGKKETIRRLK